MGQDVLCPELFNWIRRVSGKQQGVNSVEKEEGGSGFIWTYVCVCVCLCDVFGAWNCLVVTTHKAD